MKKIICKFVIIFFILSIFSFTNVFATPTLKDLQLVKKDFDILGAPSAKAVAISPDQKEIWATLLLNKKRGVSVYSLSDGKKIQDIDLDGGGGVEIVFTKDGKKAYVSQMETAKIFEIDAASKKVLQTFDTKGNWTKFLALNSDETKIFASNWESNDVSEIDLNTGKLIQKIKTVKTPRGLFVTSDDKYLYVAGYDKGEIQKINLQNGTKKIIFSNEGAMRHFTVDENKNILFASDMYFGIIWKIDLTNDKVTKFAKTEMNPNTIALSPDKNILFVSCRGTNYSAENYYKPGPDWGTVELFDTNTGKLLDVILAGNQPTALAVSSDGKYLVFSDFLDSKLEVYKVPSHEDLLKGNAGTASIYKKYIWKKNWKKVK